MTESEAYEKHKADCKRCTDEACKYGIECLQGKDIDVYEELFKYRAIGTVEEFKALKEKENRFDRNIKMFNEIGLEIRNNAIDDFAEALLRCDVIDKSVIRRIAEQMKGEQL